MFPFHLSSIISKLNHIARRRGRRGGCITTVVPKRNKQG
jgi:hypothetical protein